MESFGTRVIGSCERPVGLRNRTQVLWKKQPVLLALPLQPSTPFPVFNIRWSLAEAGPSPPHTWPYHSLPSPPGNLLHSRPPACPSFLHSHQPLQKHVLTPYLSCHPKTTHTTLVCVPGTCFCLLTLASGPRDLPTPHCAISACMFPTTHPTSALHTCTPTVFSPSKTIAHLHRASKARTHTHTHRERASNGISFSNHVILLLTGFYAWSSWLPTPNLNPLTYVAGSGQSVPFFLIHFNAPQMLGGCLSPMLLEAPAQGLAPSGCLPRLHLTVPH